MKPIIMSAAMVRATLNRDKTQTRRVIKPQLTQSYPDAYFDAYDGGPQWNWWLDRRVCLTADIIKCPYGKPGDTPWVQEAFHKHLDGSITYRADADSDSDHEIFWATQNDGCQHEYQVDTWKPAICMPKVLCRLFLRIKDIRVERIQDISIDDIAAEGVDNGKSNVTMRIRHDNLQLLAFQKLWNSINAKRGYGWDVNPWVWVLEYEVVK